MYVPSRSVEAGREDLSNQRPKYIPEGKSPKKLKTKPHTGTQPRVAYSFIPLVLQFRPKSRLAIAGISHQQSRIC